MENNVNSFSCIICIFWNTFNNYFIKIKFEYRKEKTKFKTIKWLKREKNKRNRCSNKAIEIGTRRFEES